jgi:ATP-dependent Lon protease
MEIIDITGYTVEEKVEIAKKHLIPKQLKAHGLTKKDLTLPNPIVSEIIENYTRESGVRNLDKKVASIARNVAKCKVMEEDYNINFSMPDLERVLGAEKLEKEMYQGNDTAGVVTGLAWSSVGGSILFVESALTHGKGKLQLTGQLGSVMKESATTAYTYLKSNCDKLGLKAEVFDNYDLHIHFPAGSTPKDGPSAGVTILTSLASLYTQRKVKDKLAMTGEITLRGKVLPVGGIKEKILAAKRAGIAEILMCKSNEKDVKSIPNHYLKGLKFKYVENMDDVLNHALLKTKVSNPKHWSITNSNL